VGHIPVENPVDAGGARTSAVRSDPRINPGVAAELIEASRPSVVLALSDASGNDVSISRSFVMTVTWEERLNRWFESVIAIIRGAGPSRLCFQAHWVLQLFLAVGITGSLDGGQIARSRVRHMNSMVSSLEGVDRKPNVLSAVPPVIPWS